jgi:lipopolysaccharide export system permease protein
MAVGRLSSDNEIIAFRASGISHRVLFVPMLLLGIAFSVFSFVMNDYFLPLGTIRFGNLYRELLYSNPRLELEPHSVIRYRDSTLVTGNVDGEGIDDLVIIEAPEGGERRVISADEARLTEEGPAPGVLSLELEDVFSQQGRSGQGGGYEYFSAASMVYNVLLRDITFSVRSPGPREMSSVDVYSVIREKRAELAERRRTHEASVARERSALYRDYLAASRMGAYGEGAERLPSPSELDARLESLQRSDSRVIRDRSLQIYWIEFHKKFSIPFACLAFTVFAFPVGLLTRRSGRSVGFAVGLMVAVVYWAMLIAGQTLGTQQLSYSAFLSMWAPNLLLLALGGVVRVVRRHR